MAYRSPKTVWRDWGQHGNAAGNMNGVILVNSADMVNLKGAPDCRESAALGRKKDGVL